MNLLWESSRAMIDAPPWLGTSTEKKEYTHSTVELKHNSKVSVKKGLADHLLLCNRAAAHRPLLQSNRGPCRLLVMPRLSRPGHGPSLKRHRVMLSEARAVPSGDVCEWAWRQTRTWRQTKTWRSPCVGTVGDSLPVRCNISLRDLASPI